MTGGMACVACAISVEHARKEYRAGRDALLAVADVSLKVAPATVHGLLGPNGAGKTTTLKMLLGLVRPTEGRFEILGADASAPGSRAKLGFLPEQPYFPAQLTVAGVMRLAASLAGMPAAAGRARSGELLERVGLAGRERTTVAKLSRGLLQRLGLAQALIASPEVVVLDEPASGLDPVGQRDVRDLILELRNAGTAVLLSSHQLSEVEAVCDEVTILDRGTIAARGDINDLLNVAGATAVRASGPGDELPAAVAGLVDEVVFSGGVWAFSIADASVRGVVDALDDAGWKLVALTPKRESLEDYFAALLARHSADRSGL